MPGIFTKLKKKNSHSSFPVLILTQVLSQNTGISTFRKIAGIIGVFFVVVVVVLFCFVFKGKLKRVQFWIAT